MTKTLPQWLAYIETCHLSTIALGLERIHTVLNALNLPKMRSKIITVAGTNGKGSTVATLNAIYHQHGYSVGVYTSPHLLHFNERIRINNVSVPDETLITAFEAVEKARSNTQSSLTFFEFTTLAAFYIFSHAALDVLVLEVGMGGRLDAVNLLDPDVSIITNVSRDHMAWLGDDEEAIGVEKAGILRKNTPFVYASLTCPKSIVVRAKQLNCPTYMLNRDFEYKLDDAHFDFLSADTVCYNTLPIPNLHLDNVVAGLMATKLIKNTLPVTINTIQKALQTLHLPGRLQYIEGNPGVLLDVAHNQAATEHLAEKLKHNKPKGQVHAVLAMMKDKEIKNTLAPLIEIISTWHVASFDNPRAASPQALQEHVKKLTKKNVSPNPSSRKACNAYPGSTYYIKKSNEKGDFRASNDALKVEECYTHDTIDQAFKTAETTAKQGDLIVVFGSFYTVGAVLEMLEGYATHE